MARRREIIEQIRFSIHRLSAKNGFHDFEHVARHWARSEVCRNLLPATGPVSAGGDGGADFESHSVGDPAAPWMSGEIQGAPTAFCCSLEKEVLPKAKKDLKEIAGHPRGFKRAFIITSQDFPVGKRNKLIEWAKAELRIAVEVVDGNALSEALAQPHLFWIAQEYLSIPAEMYPTEDETPWYAELRSSPPSCVDSFSKFWEIKRAVRHATEAVPQDVLFWVQLLERERLASLDPALALRMLYEEIVARLRGLGTLHGHEDLVRAFLFAFDRESLSLLKDASVIASYAVRSTGGESSFEMSEALGFARTIETIVSALLGRAVVPEERCELLAILLFLVYLRPKEEQQATAAALLRQLLKSLEAAPLFPRRPILEWMARLGERLLDANARDDANDLLDKLTAAREGQAAAAAECSKRAVRRFEDGDLLGAIRELHRAKIQWHAGEARAQMLRACLLISHCYSRLGLFEAAKYYALATLDLALSSEREEALRVSVDAAFELAAHEYARGNWVTSAALVKRGCFLAERFRDNPTDLSANKDIGAAFYGVAVSIKFAKRFAPDAEPLLRRQAEDGAFIEFVDAISKTDPWNGASDAEVWMQAGAELDGQPFDDVERVRSIRWRALGTEFHIKARNERRAVALAESLAATTQIVLASAAVRELNLTQGVVTVDVESVPGGGFNWTRQAQTKRVWSVKVGVDWTGLRKDVPSLDEAGAALEWLQSLSLLPATEFADETKALMREGLNAAVFIGRPYVELWERWVGVTGAHALLGGLSRSPMPQWTPRERAQLAWRATPLGTRSASQEEVRAAIQRRYAHGIEALSQTLARLRSSNAFQAVVRQLRSDGWRDWHILVAVFHVVMNWRLRDDPPPTSLKEAQESDRKVMEFREKPSDPAVPIEMLLDVASLKRRRAGSLVSMLPRLGLENRESSPDVSSIEAFLRARAWLDLDVEHEDPFRTIHT